MIISPTTDVLERARSGELDPWIEYCLMKLRGMAWSFERTSGVSREDLLQDVALRLYCKSEKVLAARKPMAYARVLARNVMIRHYQKAARRRRIIGRVASLDERWLA